MASGMSVICLLPRKVSRKPWKKLNVPNVTIKVGSRNIAIKRPLMEPKMAPITAATKKIKRSGAWGLVNTKSFTVPYMAVAATAVNETSIPPDNNAT